MKDVSTISKDDSEEKASIRNIKKDNINSKGKINMLKPIKTFISDKYTYEDYLNLRFELNSTEDIWKKAIEIFVDRIESRYFFAIDKLIENPDRNQMRKLGFAIVTLQCSLIDTLSKFRYGLNKQKNQERFTSFLQEYFIFDSNAEVLAKKVYKDIRCGLVHSGSTDNMSGLSCDLRKLVTILPNEAISLDIIVLDNKLRSYFSEYIKKLKDKEESELRENFVQIMNEVCKV